MNRRVKVVSKITEVLHSKKDLKALKVAGVVADYISNPEWVKTNPEDYDTMKHVIALSVAVGEELKKTQHIVFGVVIGVAATYFVMEKNNADRVRSTKDSKKNN